MPSISFQFPKDFVWGTTSTSFQMEGGTETTNWENWERIAPGLKAGFPHNNACGWLNSNQWQTDFNRAAGAFQNAICISIEWGSVQPSEKQWNENAVEHYRDMVRGLSERGLRPFVILHAFTDPLWFNQKGGWLNSDAPVYFRNYTERIHSALKAYVHDWIPILAPNIYAINSFYRGVFPPGKKNDKRSCFYILCQMASAHAAAYETIHHYQTDVSVGISSHFTGFIPKAGTLFTYGTAKRLHHDHNASYSEAFRTGYLRFGMHQAFLPQIIDTYDFIGLNYFTSFEVGGLPHHVKLTHPANALLDDTGIIANEPKGLFNMLRWASAYDKPLYIIANGIDDAEDHIRPLYLADHIHQLWHSVNFGFPVKGYFHYGLTDSFDWEQGWRRHFGLWAVDPETQLRSKRASADFYTEICRKNALDTKDAERYAPDFCQKLFAQ